MKHTFTIACLSGLLLSAGCRSYDINGTQPVRYASGVQVVPLDSMVRPVTPSIQIFEIPGDVKKPYQKIALLSRSGHREDEALIDNAFAWRARQLGADAIVLQPASHGWPDYQFHAQAIIYTSGQP